MASLCPPSASSPQEAHIHPMSALSPLPALPAFESSARSVSAHGTTRATNITYRLGDTTWTCWANAGGGYEWRSDCGRLVAWREGAAWVSTSDGHITPQPHPTLRSAMLDALCEGLLRACGFRNAQREGELTFQVGMRWPPDGRTLAAQQVAAQRVVKGNEDSPFDVDTRARN